MSALVITIRAAALPAWDQLQAALRDSPPPPCTGDPEAWTSDDMATRAYAARACLRCAVVDQCAAFAEANNETFGVWGGIDRTPAALSTARRSA